jgi:uncharacterized protein DUF1707
MADGLRPRVREADRERFLSLLREYFARGELDSEELDRRVGLVLTATYLHEAAAAVTDLQLTDTSTAATDPIRRRRGHAEAATPAAGWIPTDERFKDPTTRTVMRVWIDPADQSRHYVPDQEA